MREDELSTDSWAWSDHGQKFIKGLHIQGFHTFKTITLTYVSGFSH